MVYSCVPNLSLIGKKSGGHRSPPDFQIRSHLRFLPRREYKTIKVKLGVEQGIMGSLSRTKFWPRRRWYSSPRTSKFGQMWGIFRPTAASEIPPRCRCCQRRCANCPALSASTAYYSLYSKSILDEKFIAGLGVLGPQEQWRKSQIWQELWKGRRGGSSKLGWGEDWGSPRGLERRLGPLQKKNPEKMIFSLEMACFGEFWAVFFEKLGDNLH